MGKTVYNQENTKVMDGVMILPEIDPNSLEFNTPPADNIFLYAEDDGFGTTIIRLKRANGTEFTISNKEKAISTKTGEYSLLSTDYNILLSAELSTGKAILSQNPPTGQVWNVKCINDASGAYIDPNGRKLDDVTGLFQIYSGESVTFQSDSNQNYWII
jgi:hypothetical protein